MKEQELKNALDNIRLSDEEKKRILEKVKMKGKEAHKMKSKKIIPIALAATLVLGITAFAAASHWSSGFLQKMNIDKKQMESLQSSDSALVATPNVSDTHDGITVSTAQCLFDGNSVRMSFYVEGYELDRTSEPELEYINILLDGKIGHNFGWSFFNGIDWTDKNNPAMADGSPVQEDEDGNYINNYRIADGKMEIDLDWSPYVEGIGRLSGKDLSGKTITVIMQNFGDKKGKWVLEWTLDNFESGKTFALDSALGDTGARVTSAVLYPASAVIRVSFPKVEITEIGFDENGNEVPVTVYAEPPAFAGVKLKDGTVYTDLFGGGTEGYEDGNSEEFVARVNFSRIINTDEIESLLFVKNQLNEEAELTENNCYEVKLN